MVSLNFEVVNNKYQWVVRIHGIIIGVFSNRDAAQDYIRIVAQVGYYELAA